MATIDLLDEASAGEPTARPARWLTAERLVLGALVLVAVAAATAIHRHGHSWGDDFTLYVDQARSVFRGETREVIEDNRFAVLNAATPTFSPIGYPWGWPLLLSPFVAVVGLDYDALKWVVVALFATMLVLLHVLVRRRTGAVVALLVVAVVGLSPSMLAHTDKLLSEYPYVVAALATLLVLDRCTRPCDGWSTASTRLLVTLGLVAAVAFNVRREGMFLMAAVLAAQLVAKVPWRRLWIPHAAFLVAVVVFQLLLPTAMLPRYPGDGFHHASSMLTGPLPASIAEHLSFGAHGGGAAAVVLVLALVGAGLRMVRHAREDIALLVTPLGALVAFARFPFNFDPRYYIQVVPFAVYFAAQVAPSLAEVVQRRDRHGAGRAGQAQPAASRIATGVTIGALAVLLAVQVWHLPAPIRASRDFDRAGLVQYGPADERVRAVLDAVDEHTPQDAIVAFMKARTMTLYTDRRAVQSSDLDVVRQRATWFAQLRNSDFSQPDIAEDEALRLGWEKVWEDAMWILWRVTG